MVAGVFLAVSLPALFRFEREAFEPATRYAIFEPQPCLEFNDTFEQVIRIKIYEKSIYTRACSADEYAHRKTRHPESSNHIASSTNDAM